MAETDLDLRKEIERLQQINTSLRAENEALGKENGILKDITAHVENQLRISIEQFQLLADNIPVIVWTANQDGGLDYYNQRWYDYTGQTYEQAQGWGWGPVLHPDDLQRTVDTWNISLETSAAYEIEYRFKRASDGMYRWHLGKATPLKDQQGRVVKWFGTNTDIHEQKESEKRKDEFLSIASHELKTPLTSVKAFIQLGKKTADADTRSYQFFDKALSQLGRLEKLVADLLDVSRINAGKMVYNLEEFDFGLALQEGVESIQQTYPDYNITLTNNTNVQFNGDKLRIEQVINNFISNAVKYSPDNKKVIVRSEVKDDNIIVSVQDFGIGIAPENLNKLFDRYYRVDNTSMRFQGLGLGLFISSEIIKRHHGSFWIESEEGKGSTFYFLLPIKGQHAKTEVDTDHRTYYKSSFITVTYRPDKQWVEADWIGHQNYESVKRGCLIILDLVKRNHCKKILNDNTRVVGNWSEAVDWVGQVWFPALSNAGVKYFGWIYSPSTFSKMSAKKTVDITLSEVNSQLFTEPDEAKSWLAAAQV